MTQFNAENLRVATQWDGKVILSCEVCKESEKAVLSAAQDMHDKKMRVTAKLWRKDRSLDANAFMWALLGEMAIVQQSTDKEIYREIIKRVGLSDIVPIHADAADLFIRSWIKGDGKPRLGWFAENIGESKFEGYVLVKIYYGSSVYDTAQFSRLLDEIISEAEGMGIHTLKEDADKAKESFAENEKHNSK